MTRTIDQRLQLNGGYGSMDEYRVSRRWRDFRVMQIYGGSTAIVNEIIGRRVLGI